MREFEPRRLRLFFLFVVVVSSSLLCRYCVVSRRRRVLCGANLFSFGGGVCVAFGKKINHPQNKNFIVAFISLSLFLSPTTTTSEREREREEEERGKRTI